MSSRVNSIDDIRKNVLYTIKEMAKALNVVDHTAKAIAKRTGMKVYQQRYGTKSTRMMIKGKDIMQYYEVGELL